MTEDDRPNRPFEKIRDALHCFPYAAKRPMRPAGLPDHLTQRGTNRQRVFFSPTDYKMYLALVREQPEDSGCASLLTAC